MQIPLRARAACRVLLIFAITTLSASWSAAAWAQAATPPRGGSDVIVVVVSANAEWKVVKAVYPQAAYRRSPWGEFFETTVRAAGRERAVVFMHGGWGKVAAAGSTQYAIDRWKPSVVVNLGTCGGFGGDIKRFEVILAERTIIYDIREAMGDPAAAVADYTTAIDLGWLGTTLPTEVRKTVLVSADRDLVPAELAELKARYGAVAGDWESGAIAYTCARNAQRVLILRGVSDLVTAGSGGEAYGNLQVFEQGTRTVMTSLLEQLPKWLAMVK
jgi:adenosylhomocysteine nucleosidase